MQNMIDRKYTFLIEKHLQNYPAVTLLGPRQSGKTTLSKSLNGDYFDLENEADRVSLDINWNTLMSGDRLVILDEAQEWPELFRRLRGAIDQDRKRNGRFLLLGSVSPTLMRHVSESLAGRMALLELTPFLWNELPGEKHEQLWLCGGYPDGGILRTHQYPQWQQQYLELLATRDLPHWGLPAKPQMTLRLIKMLAAVHGQTLNASQLGQSLDISYKTVQHYLEYLEGTFLIRQLQSYHANLKKRLVKRPKIYWRDSGLLHAVLNVSDDDDLLCQPWVGASWEGYVIEQIIGALKLNDKFFTPYFLRTDDRYEIDLILDFGKEQWAIEIKLTSSPAVSDLQKLSKIADMIGASRRILISRTLQNVDNGKVISCNLEWLINHLAD